MNEKKDKHSLPVRILLWILAFWAILVTLFFILGMIVAILEM